MRGFLAGWGVRILIIAIIAVGALVLRDRLSGNAGDLKVGDCFDEPAGATQVEDVQHHPCTEAHTSEVVFVGDVPGDSKTYPALTAFDDYGVANCSPAFTLYTGRDFSSETELTMGYFYPLAEGWGKGDREMTCYAIRVDSKPVTASFKKAP
jgi:hypothetical protein